MFTFAHHAVIFKLTSVLFSGYPSGLEIDYSTAFIIGHSSGNHVVIEYMKLGCHNIKGMVLVSPVDGVDPFGLLDDFCITPGEMLPFDVPTLVISAGFDSTPGTFEYLTASKALRS